MATTLKETLENIEIFQILPPQDLAKLEQRCRWRRYAADQELVRYLDEDVDVYFLIGGRVRAVFYSMSGKEVTFRDLIPGQVFGEFAAIDGKPRSASIIALEDSLVAVMPAATFWQVLREYPQVTEVILKRLVGFARTLSDRVVEFSTLAVKNRIQAELLRLARTQPEQDNIAVISPAPTHAEIASRVSTHREAVTRELSALGRAGLIERRKDGLVIRDVRELARLVEEVSGEPRRPAE